MVEEPKPRTREKSARERQRTQDVRDVAINSAATRASSDVLVDVAQRLFDSFKLMRTTFEEDKAAFFERQRRDRVKLFLLAVIIVISLIGNFVQSRYNGTQINILRSATDPQGEIYKRGQEQTGCAILDIINDNHRLHGVAEVNPRELGLTCP